MPETNSSSDLTDEQVEAILATLEEIQFSKIALYEPYSKQASFHEAGATYRERLLRAGNQNGKTFCGGCEGAYHLTGQYPEWWTGRRFNEPIMMWATGVTGETTRDNVQRVLMGPLGEPGTGTLPLDVIVDSAPARGIADLLDYVKIRHISGGLSTLRFKYYEQGRQKWQGPPVHVVWFDEEPPSDIYDEGMARTIATNGIAYLTFTPLQGMSDVVYRFLSEVSEDRHDTNMTIDDALHIPESRRAQIIASFPAHEREARANGTPVFGEGRIFEVTEESLRIDPIKIPDFWPQIGGLDFGWGHPTAAVKMAWDRDNDVLYVTAEYRVKEETPAIHSLALKEWGTNLVWSWPHDGLQHSKDSGEQLATQYRRQGLAMLTDHATFPDGTNGVEAGLMEMLDRMMTGRWKVFSTCPLWFEEFRTYHRKRVKSPNGGFGEAKVFKERDDLICASRYAMMMKRRARVMSGRPVITIEGAGSYNIHTGSYQGRH